MDEIKIISANVNGMNSPRKRNSIFQLEKYKADITCIQETHIKEKDEKYLKNRKLGKLFFAADKGKKKRGVAIYIKSSIYSI